MKKILVVIILLLLSTANYGQFALGFKVGYNTSKFSVPSGSDSIQSSASSGFHGGAFARIGDKLFLQPEAYYTSAGSTIEKTVSAHGDLWKQKVTTGTFDIPVMIGFKVINSSIFKLRIMAGPEVAFKVRSKISDISGTGPIKDSNISKTNWYGQVGAGVDVLILTFDVRYQFGFSKVINDVTTSGTKPVTYPVNSKSNLLLVSVGTKLLWIENPEV